VPYLPQSFGGQGREERGHHQHRQHQLDPSGRCEGGSLHVISGSVRQEVLFEMPKGTVAEEFLVFVCVFDCLIGAHFGVSRR
jgi:hypothetical protein